MTTALVLTIGWFTILILWPALVGIAGLFLGLHIADEANKSKGPTRAALAGGEK